VTYVHLDYIKSSIRLVALVMVNAKSAPGLREQIVYHANQPIFCSHKTKHAAIPHANPVVPQAHKNVPLAGRVSYFVKEPALLNVRQVTWQMGMVNNVFNAYFPV
jgi:hypothetical protein